MFSVKNTSIALASAEKSLIIHLVILTQNTSLKERQTIATACIMLECDASCSKKSM